MKKLCPIGLIYRPEDGPAGSEKGLERPFWELCDPVDIRIGGVFKELITALNRYNARRRA